MTFTHPENVIINQPTPFAGRLVDVQLGGVSKAYVDQDGNVFINGNVGIGTAGPGGRVHVITAGNLKGLIVQAGASPQTATLLEIRDSAGVNRLSVYESNQLEFNRSDGITMGYIRGSGNPFIVTADGAGIDLSLRTYTGDVVIATGNPLVEKMRVLQSNGNVGIGTAAPTARLEVVSGAGVDNGIRVGMGAVANLRLGRSDAPAQTYILRTDSDQKFKVIDETALGAPTRLAMDTSGNVGIGTTTPQNKLDVEGAAVIGASYSGTNIGPTNGLLVEGNVGIGTPTPSSKLDIVGDISVSGNVDGVDVSAHAANVNAHHAQTHGNADHTAAPTPSQIDIGDTALTGTDAGPARGDHQHAFPAPAGGYPQNVAASEADGTATTPARADHVHAHGSGYLANAHHAQAHGDGDHSAVYALLGGRAGGQTLIGGTGSGEHLQLQSTSHVTKGRVQFHNTLNFIDASGNLTLVGNISASGNISTSAGEIAVAQQKRFYLNGMGGTKYMWQSDQAGDGLEGRIAFSYNLFVKQNSGPAGDPASMWIGTDKDNLLYLFFQDRSDPAGKWGGILTFRRSDTAPLSDYGYGYQPIRFWGKNALIDPQGVTVLRDGPIAPAIYFQNQLVHLQHRNLDTGNFEVPDYYDAGNRPWKNTPTSHQLGGISWDTTTNGLGVNISRIGNELLFKDIDNPAGVRLNQLVRGDIDRLKVARGETSNFTLNALEPQRDFGTFSLPSGLFASAPKIFLTPKNSSSAWSVGLTAYNISATSFGIMGQNNYNGQSIFSIQWMAVGT